MIIYYYLHYLDEARFSKNNGLKHYYKHVIVDDDEDIDPQDPKFPKMSIADYFNRAKKLSEEPAGSSDSNEPIIGFYTAKTLGPNHSRRAIKIKIKSDLVDGYSEAVVYNPGDDFIISYMLCKPNKLERELQHFDGELTDMKSADDQKKIEEKLSKISLL